MPHLKNREGEGLISAQCFPELSSLPTVRAGPPLPVPFTSMGEPAWQPSLSLCHPQKSHSESESP